MESSMQMVPELTTQERLFFENVDNFPDDEIMFQQGSPGSDKRNENADRQVNEFDEALVVTEHIRMKLEPCNITRWCHYDEYDKIIVFC